MQRENIHFLLVFVLITNSLLLNSQVIDFNDLNFKSVLLSASTNNNIALNEMNQPIVIDVNANGQIDLTESELVFKINVPVNSNVTDLEGVEYFSNLTDLKCSYNNLTELDVSMLGNLFNLYVDHNQLETLNINTSLQRLYCQNNDLENIDFSQSTLIQQLNCSNNNLTELNLNDQTSLLNLNCSENQLSELNLSNAQLLTNLNCRNNQLTILNIQSNPLVFLDCSNNLLTELNLTGVGDDNSSTPLIIDCQYNDLTSIDTSVALNSKVNLNCSFNSNLNSLYLKNEEIFYDNPPELPPLPSVEFIDNFSLQFICADEFNFDYLESKLLLNGITDCELASDCNLGASDVNQSKFLLYPNPTTDVVYIKSNVAETIKYIRLYNALGQLIYSLRGEIEIDLSGFERGIYFLKVSFESSNEITSKLILK